MSEQRFHGWAVLEVLGHRRLGGYVSDVELFGVRKIRIEVPKVTPEGRAGETLLTQYYSPASMFALTPVDEETACAVAKRTDPSPVHPWEMPRPALPAGEVEEADIEYVPGDYDPDDEEPCAACDGSGCDQCDDPFEGDEDIPL